MAKFHKPVDPWASEAIRLAPSDPNEAARALRLAEKYIREGKPLPSPLDTYLADAILYSMEKEHPEDRNAQFLRELFLVSEPNRRPSKARAIDVGPEMAWRIKDGPEELLMSQNKAAKEVGKLYGVSRSTAVRLYEEWQKIEKEIAAIDREDSYEK